MRRRSARAGRYRRAATGAPRATARRRCGSASSASRCPTATEETIFTVGHSTRSAEELVSLLETAGVRELVDVRTVPRSRRNPQFNSDALAATLAGNGLGYLHERELGGFRRPRADSLNTGWTVEAFRGYADYMDSDQFRNAVARLIDLARQTPTTVMCAEAQWWRCHRRLIADAVTIRGWRVLHLGLKAEPVAHELTSFAVVEPGDRLTYPPAQASLDV